MGEMIRVEGLDGVGRFLEQLDQKSKNQAMTEGLSAGGKVMYDAVLATTPVKEIPGGKLPANAMRSDLSVQVTRKYGAPMAIVQFGKLTYYIARWVEYGHRLIRRRKSGTIKLKVRGGGLGQQIGDVKQHPFIRPAYESSITSSIAAFTHAFWQALKGRG